MDDTIDYQAADFIENGADLLDHGEWLRHKQKRGNSFCAYGALIWANRGLYRSISVRRRAYNTLARLGEAPNIGAQGVIYWNDTKAKDKQEVLDTFRKAAKELRTPKIEE